MRLIFLGAPGAGKSTVAKLLTQLDGSVQTQPAIYVRGAVQAGSELDNKAKEPPIKSVLARATNAP